MTPLLPLLAVLAGCLNISDTEADNAGDRDEDGFVALEAGGDDCDDADAAVFPGAVETCNGTDDDCDGRTDNDALDGTTWFADIDGDGFGGNGDRTVTCAAAPPDGYRSDSDDCDDFDVSVHPGATDVCNEGVDDDCDGDVDEDGPVWYRDADADGFGDADASVVACQMPPGHIDNADDCDDADDDVRPGGIELCNLIDDDCDGQLDQEPVDGWTYFRDSDGDGYGDETVSTVACDLPTGHSVASTDCDDTDELVHPAADEVCNDHVDNDCDGGRGACIPEAEVALGLTDSDAFWGESGDRLGWGLAGQFDFDGDGQLDLAIGAMGIDGGDLDAGVAYVFAGPITAAQPIDDAIAVIEGDAQGLQMGRVLGSPGDVDGDALDELAIASASAYEGGPQSGAVFVFSGGATGAQSVDSARAVVLGAEGARLGQQLAWGDLDNDGVVDLLIGAPGDSSGEPAAGAAWVVSADIVGTTTASDAGFALLGETSAQGAGAVVAVGDVDGDGLADAVIGAPESRRSGTESGSVYMARGPLAASSLADAAVAIDGTPGAALGSAAAVVGDIDGDGLDDVAIGAPWAQQTIDGSPVGMVYVVLGGMADGDALITDIAAGWSTGNVDGGLVGADISAVGDLDDDGRADWVVSGTMDLATGTQPECAAWLMTEHVLGAHSLVDVAASRMARNPEDRCGTRAVALGDVNGDGIGDAALSCSSASDADRYDSGAVWLLMGIGL